MTEPMITEKTRSEVYEQKKLLQRMILNHCHAQFKEFERVTGLCVQDCDFDFATFETMGKELDRTELVYVNITVEGVA
jgi:hypothetical protein